MTNTSRARSRELAAINAELNPGYSIVQPAPRTAPFVFCSPHSGRVYPSVLRDATRLDALTLRKSEDCYVDELFADVARHGAPFLVAHFPRAYLDVNREPFELDPELFRVPLPANSNTQSVRVSGGLGTIARVVSDAEEIYAKPLPLEAALARIEKLYVPFHATLDSLLVQTRDMFGSAILIDCHSMPSATSGHPAGRRADFVLGDRFGETCDPRLTRYVRDVLTVMGYQVHLNRPYAGGYITEHYGRPSENIQSLQIEINRALYMNEVTLERTSQFERLRLDLGEFVERLFAEQPLLMQPRAAE